MSSKILVDELAGKTTASHIIMPAGAVLQTLFAESTTATSITSSTQGSGTSTGLSLTITPHSATNKLLFHYIGHFELAQHSNPWVSVEIHDGSSVVATDGNAGVYVNGNGDEFGNRWRYPFMAFITPSGSGAITYTVRAWKQGNAVTAQPSSMPSHLLIQEIQQ